jgi:hypothetical protein
MWLWPLLAAVPTVAFVILVYAAVLRSLQPSTHVSRARESPPDFDAQVQSGRKALAAGKFRLAADELQQAVGLLETHPERRRGAEGRDVTQLHRQAALLADLLTEPLGGILHSAKGMPEEEWEAQFASRYRGHAVIFDADVTRDGAGQYRLDYQLMTDERRPAPEEGRRDEPPPRIEVGDLRLLAALPRDRPPRLLFGARLASVAREPPGVWVIRFEPDSGVLLTDPAVVAACCPPPVDEDLLAVSRRQKAWLDEFP